MNILHKTTLRSLYFTTETENSKSLTVTAGDKVFKTVDEVVDMSAVCLWFDG